MKPRLSTLISVVLLVAVIFAWRITNNGKEAVPAFQANTDLTQTSVIFGDNNFMSEIAKTETEKATGLSYRENLKTGSAMLFIFETPSRPSFWMREMKFPLDLIWINSDLIVIDITRDAPPPNAGTLTQDLPTYSPNSDISYVLEVNAGESDTIKIGDPVVITKTNQL